MFFPPKLLCRGVFLCLWGLWKSRNNLIFTNKRDNPSNVEDPSLEFLDNSRANAEQRIERMEDHPSKWIPPDDDGWLKLNFDASFSHSGAGFGYVLRNQLGAGPLRSVMRAEHAEIMAAWNSWQNIREYHHGN